MQVTAKMLKSRINALKGMGLGLRGVGMKYFFITKNGDDVSGKTALTLNEAWFFLDGLQLGTGKPLMDALRKLHPLDEARLIRILKKTGMEDKDILQYLPNKNFSLDSTGIEQRLSMLRLPLKQRQKIRNGNLTIAATKKLLDEEEG